MMPYRFALILLLLPFISKAQPLAENSRPFVLGAVRTLPSAVLSENRTLNIYLPEGYHEEATTAYPVIYLLDGSANEDFIHISGLVQFLSMMSLMPRSIVVGIANIDRKRDFTFPTTIPKDKKDFPTTGGSEKFIRFIEKELEPYIESHYRTTTKTLIGQSLGGLLATEILLRHPSLFDNYFIVSPSLWWDKESLLSVKPTPHPDRDLFVYIAVGKEGDIMEGDARKLAKRLQKDAGIAVRLQYFPDEDHATILHEAIYKALKQHYPRKASQ